MKHISKPFMFRLAVLLCCAANAITHSAVEAADPAGIQASSSNPIHPVLIRNEYGPIVRVVVDVNDATDAKVEAVEFQLDCTDEIESLTLFWSGDKERFSAEIPFGDPAEPASTVEFRDQQALSLGRNVFWLSCRLKDTAQLREISRQSTVPGAGGTESESLFENIRTMEFILTEFLHLESLRRERCYVSMTCDDVWAATCRKILTLA
jgi:hypothetical protein